MARDKKKSNVLKKELSRSDGSSNDAINIASGYTPEKIKTIKLADNKKTTVIKDGMSEEAFEASNEVLEQKKKDVETFKIGQEGIIAKHAKLLTDWETEAKSDKEKYGGRADLLDDKFTNISNILDKTVSRLGEMKIDPDRYVKEMGSFQKVMSIIGAAFGGFAEGMSGGKLKNMGPIMIQKAIDRDIDAQKSDLAAKIRSAGFKESIAKRIFNQFDVNSKLKKEAAMQQSKLQLANIGVQSKSIDIRNKVADMITGIDEKIVDLIVKKDGSKSVTKTFGSRTAAFKTGGKKIGVDGEKTPAAAQSKILDGIAAIRNTKRAKKMYKKYAPIRGTAWVGGDTAKYNSVLRAALTRHVKFITGVAARPEEYDRIKSQYGEGIGIGEFSQKQGLWKFDKLIDSQVKEMGDAIRTYPNMLKSIPVEYRKEILSAMSGGKISRSDEKPSSDENIKKRVVMQRKNRTDEFKEFKLAK